MVRRDGPIYDWWWTHRWLLIFVAMWHVHDSVQRVSILPMVMSVIHLSVLVLVSLLGMDRMCSLPLALGPLAYDSDDSDATVICSEVSSPSTDDEED